MAGTCVAGKDASVTIGAVPYAFAYWSAEFPTDALLTTAFGSEFRSRIGGLKDVKVTLRGRYKMGAMPLVQGSVITVELMITTNILASGPLFVDNIKPVADTDDTQNPIMIEVTGVCADDWTVDIL